MLKEFIEANEFGLAVGHAIFLCSLFKPSDMDAEIIQAIDTQVEIIRSAKNLLIKKVLSNGMNGTLEPCN